MQRRPRDIRVNVDGYTRFCLTAIAVLLTVLIIGLWAEGVPGSAEARAEKAPVFGDTGAQRQVLVDAQKATNAKLDELIALLKSGQVKVQVVQPGKAGPGGEGNAVPKPRE